MKKQNFTTTFFTLTALSLTAALMLALPGCQASRTQNQPDTTVPQNPETEPSTEPNVTWKPVETTVDPGDLRNPMPTETEPEETEPASPAELQVVRALDISQSAMEALMARHPGSTVIDDALPLVHLTDRSSLDDFLTEAGSQTLQDACEIYDSAFFQEHDLLIVPRVTTTGSARHTVDLAAEEGILAAKITVTVPEIATMDMANWFLAIPVSKADTQGKTCVAYLVPYNSFAHAPINRLFHSSSK